MRSPSQPTFLSPPFYIVSTRAALGADATGAPVSPLHRVVLAVGRPPFTCRRRVRGRSAHAFFRGTLLADLTVDAISKYMAHRQAEDAPSGP